MSFRTVPVRILLVLAVLGATLASTSPATAHTSHDHEPADGPVDVPLFLAHDESLFEEIAAPFACGTEWSGGTRSGHGQNDWNLDFNRTSLDYGVNRQHDLGQPLFAQSDGTVTYIGWQVNAGTYLDIDYGDYGVRYIHLVDDSVVPALGDPVTQGETIALIGDTGNTPGFAHLHLEYWDSRGFDDARIWTLKQAGQPQTEVTFDGNVVDPDEVIVSSNCVGDALAAGSEGEGDEPDEEAAVVTEVVVRSLLEEATDLMAAEDPIEHLAGRFAATGAESLAGTTDAADFVLGDDLAVVVPGDSAGGEVVLAVVHHRRASACPDGVTSPCTTPFSNAIPTAMAINLIAQLVEEPSNRTVLFLVIGDDDDAGTALAELLAPTDPIPLLDPLIDVTVAAVHLEALGESATLRLRNDSVLTGTASFAEPAEIPDLGGPTSVQWHRFAQHPAGNGNTASLAALGVPTLGLTDVDGPCRGSGEQLSLVDPGKADHQLGDAGTLLRWLADADTEPIVASPDRSTTVVDDLTRLVELLEIAMPVADDTISRVADITADVEALLADPVEDWTDDELAQAEGLLLLLDNVFVDELCASHAAPAPFVDVPETSFALLDVALLFDLEITTGTTPTTYSPGDDVTREQMAAFLARIWRFFNPDAQPSVDMPFDDVDPSSFAFDDIRLLWELGITTGTSPTTYSPDDNVTREQMAAFLGRIGNAWTPAFPNMVGVDPHPFTDVDPASYAATWIDLLYHHGITTGTSPTTYSPDDNVTREQMAAFLGRTLRVLDRLP